MKRRLAILAIFLLLGAVVNVGVAWGFAFWVDLTWGKGERRPLSPTVVESARTQPGACPGLPARPDLPRFAAFCRAAVWRISLTASAIDFYSDSRSRSHNMEVGVCNVL